MVSQNNMLDERETLATFIRNSAVWNGTQQIVKTITMVRHVSIRRIDMALDAPAADDDDDDDDDDVAEAESFATAGIT